MFKIRRCLSITPASANGANENGESYANSTLDPAITPGRLKDNSFFGLRCPDPKWIDHRQCGDASGVFRRLDLVNLLDLRHHDYARAVVGWSVCLQADQRQERRAGICQPSRPKAHAILGQELSRTSARRGTRAIAVARETTATTIGRRPGVGKAGRAGNRHLWRVSNRPGSQQIDCRKATSYGCYVVASA